MKTLVSFDTETFLIGYHNVVPDFVCLTYSQFNDGYIDEEIVCRMDEGYKTVFEWLFEDDKELVAHNAAYDLAVLAVDHPAMMPLIWKKLDEGLVHDTMLREMLYNLTDCGDIDNPVKNGVSRRQEYGLAQLILLYFDKDRTADKDDEDGVRLNYSAMADKPLEEWPIEFIDYAKEDATDTLKLYLEQQKRGQALKERTGYDPFALESFRVRTHFALQLMTMHGNLLDRNRILAVTEEFEALYNDPALVEPLVYSSFIRAYAEANSEPVTRALIRECLEAVPQLPSKERKAWAKQGIIVPAIPELPYAKNAKNHLETCYGHKEHPDYPKKAVTDCGCPPKMKKAQPEKQSDKTLWEYIWKAGFENDAMEVWASDSLKKLLREQGFKDRFLQGQVIDQQVVEEHYGNRELPKDWRVSTDKEWMASFALLDPLLEIYSTRQEYKKIITSYLPGLYWKEGEHNCLSLLPGETSRLAGKEPVDIVHSCFAPLKRTGRTSSYASAKGKGIAKKYLYPSWNGQQVDPRIRPCVVPRPGYVLFSIDYASMELGTLAQTCRNIFGYSVLGDIINAGKDAHGYLAASIAKELDSYFRHSVQSRTELEAFELFETFKKESAVCESLEFQATWEALRRTGSVLWSRLGHDGEALWKDFHKYYRTLAKPTGLGYPGGLGPKTFVAYAKATFGVDVDMQTAYKLRDIWKETFPEMREYLDYTSKQSFDPDHMPEMTIDKEGEAYKRKFYCYNTPLGMHRARTDFCACANGRGLQSPSAEGALLALQEIQREIHCGIGVLGDVDGVPGVRPTIFLHDEIFGEIRDDELLTPRILRMKEIMVECMQIITPDVKADTEEALMYRWRKGALPYYVVGRLRPCEEAFYHYCDYMSNSLFKLDEPLGEGDADVLLLTPQEYEQLSILKEFEEVRL